jgi:hypothetical protein
VNSGSDGVRQKLQVSSVVDPSLLSYSDTEGLSISKGFQRPIEISSPFEIRRSKKMSRGASSEETAATAEGGTDELPPSANANLEATLAQQDGPAE